MTLRRKLLTVFAALALLSLVLAGMTLWVVNRWQSTQRQTENHYQRSLLLQRVRAATFRAFKEVPDAVTGDDPDSEQEFDLYIEPATADFETWAKLADSDEEQAQVREVRRAFDQLIVEAKNTFALVKAGKMREAFELMEGKLEDQDFAEFQRATETAVVSDREKREIIRQDNHNTRRTAQIVLAIAAFSTLSLVLLLAAYLASDLFKPLGELKKAIERATQGDYKQPLATDRDDEFGTLNRAFNLLQQVVQRRERAAGEKSTGGVLSDRDDEQNEQLRDTTSRLALHTLVQEMRAHAVKLAVGENKKTGKNGDETLESESPGALIDRLERLSQAVVRITDFSFPLDLNLAQTNIRDLLYDVVLRFHDELSRRGVSLELELAPDVEFARIDRLKIREAVTELVRNALKALPEQSGKIGLRARIINAQLLIEVANNNLGASDIDVFELAGDKQTGVGLRLTKAIVEQHGGKLLMTSETGAGTYVQILLPLREES